VTSIERDPVVDFALVFVTAGEMPSASGLHASQVIEPAAAMVTAGRDVTWLAAVPLLSFLRDVSSGGDRIATARRRCESAGIRFEYVVVALSIAGLLSFLFRTPILGNAARRMRARLERWRGRRTIFHCRSYYAAQFAWELRQTAPAECWRVSFDMRSVLPEEFPLTLGPVGKACFGFAKQWEHELLARADVSFLPLEHARLRMRVENDRTVVHAPIQGFDRASGWQIDFPARWHARRIGYAGSIAAWHDPSLLQEMLTLLPGGRPVLAMAPDARMAGFDCRQYPLEEMPAVYSGLVALVIPGRADIEDYFVSFKVRCNFFSTKAAEALSLGVPLIVSSALAELADFVRTHDCGVIYDPISKRVVHPLQATLDDATMWARLTENAQRAGESFVRSKVLALYQGHWEALFTTEAEC
jgi:hypothetical protein